jgi:type IV secretory pathway TraG/TraD family ATPase VirD4
MALFRPKVIGSRRPDALLLANYRNPDGSEGAEIRMPGQRTVLICGKPRSGKDTGIVLRNLLMASTAISNVVVDTRLEAACVSLAYRRTQGPAWIANMFNEHVARYRDMQSDGLNLLTGHGLGAHDPLLFENLCSLILALIPKEGDKNPFFALTAQSLWAGLGKQEVKEAKREGRKASWLRVRLAATEGEAALRARVKRIMAEGDPQICSLLAIFDNAATDGIRDVIATGAAHTMWMLSDAFSQDERLGKIDLALLGQVPSSLFFGLPHGQTKFFAPYLRTVITEILRPLFSPHPVPVRLFINELAAMGKIDALDALGLVAGSGVQLVLIVQSLVQLRDIYGEGWQSFFGQCGAVCLVGSPGDNFSAEYFSKHSGEITIRMPHTGYQINSHGPGSSGGDAYTRRPFLMEQDLNNIPDGEGWIWLAGLNDPVPVIYPPYYRDPVLNRRARANPFYRG